jgi:hypothetical protein
MPPTVVFFAGPSLRCSWSFSAFFYFHPCNKLMLVIIMMTTTGDNDDDKDDNDDNDDKNSNESARILNMTTKIDDEDGQG